MDGDGEATLRRAYAAFNARDIDGAVALMTADVQWANGMDGGFVHGRDGVRDYWTRQWSVIQPSAEPVEFEALDDGRMAVRVHQVIREMDGTVRAERMVRHVYRLRGGLVAAMEIEKS